MTVGQLRDVLSEIKNQNLEVDDNIDDIIALGNYCFFLDSKIEKAYNNHNLETVKSFENKRNKTIDKIINYQGKVTNYQGK